MHRKLGWYLVELDNELKTSKTEAERTELLREVESHVREHAEELRAKGLDEQHSIDSALLAMGPPAEVARMQWKAPRWLIVALVVPLALLSYLLISNVVIRVNDFSGTLTGFHFGYIWVVFALLAALTLLTRKLFAPMLSIGALALTVLYCLATAGNFSYVDFGGSRILVESSSTGRMIETREAWANQHLTVIDKIGDPKSQAIATILEVSRDGTGGYLYPSESREGVRTFLSQMTFRLLPGQRLTPMIMASDIQGQQLHRDAFSESPEKLLGSTSAMPNLARTDDPDEAVRGWRKNGPFYMAGLKARVHLLYQEVVGLRHPLPSTFGERFVRICPLPLGIVGVSCLIAVLLNIILLWPLAFRDAKKKKAWRRRFA